MAKRQAGPTMFDLLEQQEMIERGECKHPNMKRSSTVWPGDTSTRYTMTCVDCKYIRGRYPQEGWGLPDE